MPSYRHVLVLLLSHMVLSVEEETFTKVVVNVGEDFTFDCFPPVFYDWIYRRRMDHNPSPDGFPVSSYIQEGDVSSIASFFANTDAYNYIRAMSDDRISLTIRNMTILDTANYSCVSISELNSDMSTYEPMITHYRYDVRVIGCSCVSVVHQHKLGFTTNRVTCSLDMLAKFSPPTAVPVTITIDARKLLRVTLEDGQLIFNTNRDVRRGLNISFNPFSDFEGRVSCIVSAVPVSAPTTITSESTMQSILTTSGAQLTSPPMLTSYRSMLTNTSTHTPPPMTSCNYTAQTDGHVIGRGAILIVCAVLSVVILILVIVIIVLGARLKHVQRNPRRTSGRNDGKEESYEAYKTKDANDGNYEAYIVRKTDAYVDMNTSSYDTNTAVYANTNATTSFDHAYLETNVYVNCAPSTGDSEYDTVTMV